MPVAGGEKSYTNEDFGNTNRAIMPSPLPDQASEALLLTITRPLWDS
jgi:hypothetical protein